METERRKHKRLPLKLSVLCQKIGVSADKVYSGRTVNVSPGGMLIDLNAHDLAFGELVNVALTVPPTEGLLEWGGSFSSYARVVRTGRTTAFHEPAMLHSIALEYCQSPHYQI